MKKLGLIYTPARLVQPCSEVPSKHSILKCVCLFVVQHCGCIPSIMSARLFGDIVGASGHLVKLWVYPPYEQSQKTTYKLKNT